MRRNVFIGSNWCVWPSLGQASLWTNEHSITGMYLHYCTGWICAITVNINQPFLFESWICTAEGATSWVMESYLNKSYCCRTPSSLIEPCEMLISAEPSFGDRAFCNAVYCLHRNHMAHTWPLHYLFVHLIIKNSFNDLIWSYYSPTKGRNKVGLPF